MRALIVRGCAGYPVKAQYGSAQHGNNRDAGHFPSAHKDPVSAVIIVVTVIDH